MASDRRGVGIWFGVGVALLAAVVTGWLALRAWQPASGAPATVDMNGQAVHLEVTPSPADAASMKVREDLGTSLAVPSVGLDVPLGALDEVNGSIVPPGFTSAYLVRNRGVAPENADQGTVYVVTHSIAGRGMAPGDYLFDADLGEATVDEGARIQVAGAQYRVTAGYSVDKSDLAGRDDLWTNTPDRLVLITCLQKPSGAPSTSNLVIEADRVP